MLATQTEGAVDEVMHPGFRSQLYHSQLDSFSPLGLVIGKIKVWSAGCSAGMVLASDLIDGPGTHTQEGEN